MQFLRGERSLAGLYGLLFTIGTTLVIGRFFCAYVCPMGASIDFLDFLFFRKKKRLGLKAEASFRRAKYFLLIIFIVAALTGLSLAFLMDPLALLTRFYTFFIYPLAITLINLVLDLLRPLFQALGWAALSHLHYFQSVYYMTGITLLIFGGIIVLNRLVPAVLVPLSMPIRSLPQLDLTSWTF